MGQGYAPGKVILVGEHFVVHGAPAVALPIVKRGIEVSLEPGGSEPWGMPEATARYVRRLLAELGVDDTSLTLKLESSLPVGAGLGGSAAIAVALIKALDDEGGLDTHEVRRRAHRLERLAHGNPSGIDDTVAAYGCPVYFVKGEEPRVMPELPLPALWIGLTAERTSTIEAVAHVARLASERPSWFAKLCDEATELSQDALQALERAAWPELGALLCHGHKLLQRVEVSTPALDRLVHVAVDAGAYGAKLTGGGLGGAVIALAPEDVDLGQAWLSAGATEVIAP